MAATSASSFFTPLFLSTNTHSSPLLSLFSSHSLSLSWLKASPPPPMSFHAHCSSSSSSSSQNGSLPESLNSRTQTMTMTSFDAITGEGSIPKPSYRWQRVLLKVSGEVLAGDHTQNIDPKVTMSIAREVASVTQLGIQWLVGETSFAEPLGQGPVALIVPLQITLEPYIRRRAVRHLEKGRVVIFAAGTGNPFFTTDTAAALRCAEISAEVMLKATNVDGVYDEDPKLNPKAHLLESLSYQDVTTKDLSVMDMTAITLCQENNIPVSAEVMLKATNVDGVYDEDPKLNPKAHLLESLSYQDVTTKDLSVMDMTAITLCQENNIPVVVFNLNKPGNIAKAIVGERVGTLIGGPQSQLHRPEGNITDIN